VTHNVKEENPCRVVIGDKNRPLKMNISDEEIRYVSEDHPTVNFLS